MSGKVRVHMKDLILNATSGGLFGLYIVALIVLYIRKGGGI